VNREGADATFYTVLVFTLTIEYVRERREGVRGVNRIKGN